MNRYPPHHFALLRILFGASLAAHFIHLIPSAPQRVSGALAIQSAGLQLSHAASLEIPPAAAYCLVAISALLALALAAGRGGKAILPLLAFGWIASLSSGAIHSLPLLAAALLGFAYLLIAQRGEPWRYRKSDDNPNWKMPPGVFLGLWIAACLFYSIHGLDLLRIQEYATSALSLAFPILALHPKTRPFAWYAILAQRGGELAFGADAGLAIGAALFHFLLFDPGWHAKRPDPSSERIVYFDGLCGFCDASVNTLLALDRQALLKFAPLQGQTAQAKLSADLIQNLDTIIYATDGKVLARTDAILTLCRDLGGLWSWAYGAILIPRPLRDAAYRAFAARRYQLFGKRDACRLPTPEERSRFLD